MLPNRLVRSATWEGMADAHGIPGTRLGDLWADLAYGGVGLIVGGYMHVLPEGQGLPGQTGIFDDQHVEPLAKLVERVHQAGGLIAAQLAHAGRHTHANWIGRQPLGPSGGYNQALKEEIREMDSDYIKKAIQAFGQGARRAKEAGFDAVQLHAAHGYLINQFLSPAFNQRQDEYGGSLENRARFCVEAYQAVRAEVGREYPVFIKMNSDDGVPRGFTVDQAVKVAQELANKGMNAIEVSGGVAGGGKAHRNGPGRVVGGPEEEGYFLDNALVIKEKVKVPVISVGGWRSVGRITEALNRLDAIAMSRPLIKQPDLPALWRAGDESPASCVSCGKCLATGQQGGIYCAKGHEIP